MSKALRVQVQNERGLLEMQGGLWEVCLWWGFSQEKQKLVMLENTGTS